MCLNYINQAELIFSCINSSFYHTNCLLSTIANDPEVVEIFQHNNTVNT